MHRIYVVDPDASIRDALKTLLGSFDIPVSTFASAADLIDKAGYSVTGCVLIEAEQQGVNGLELLQRLRSHGNDVPYVLLTAHAQAQFVARARRDGASGVLEKPLLDDDVVAELKRVCGDLWPGLDVADTH